MKIPFGISRMSLKRFAVKQDAYLITRFKFTAEVRNIYTFRKLYCSNFSPRKLDNNSAWFDEDQKDKVSLESADKHGFKAVCNKQDQFLSKLLQNECERVDTITNQDWSVLKNSVLETFGTINDKNIDAIIMKYCYEFKCLSLGKSYFKYLKSTNKPINRPTYGNYLRLFYSCKSDCTSDDLHEIAVVYKELTEVHHILDAHTAGKAICALSLTENWREYEKLFIAIKQFYPPTTFIYKTVILTAFDHQEFNLGWKLMEEMQYQGLNVPEEVFSYWFQKVKFRKMEEDLFRVFNFLNYFNRKPSNELCKSIKEVYEEYNEEGEVMFTRIARNGECRSCQAELEPCHVSKKDFDELKKAFLNPVIIGKDIFQKTKPEEFKGFLYFLKKSAPFDIVLDGLNIALNTRKKSISEATFRLKSVVKYFANKNVLVLGRKHMTSWKTHDMEYIRNNASMFLTDNLSQDDPFMLYAALYSGPDTCFVSQDMMRSHKFLLANPKLQITFQKWQSTRQYFLTHIGTNGKVYFQEPVSFLQSIQQNSKGDWHIPYFVLEEDLTTWDRVDHLHRHWLCLQKKSDRLIRPRRPKEPCTDLDKKMGNYNRPVKKLAGKINLKNLFREDDL